MSGSKEIQERIMVQLRVNAFVRGRFRQAMDSIYVGSANVSKVLKILLEAEKKIRKITNDEMRKVR